jgi:hypothetical protein
MARAGSAGTTGRARRGAAAASGHGWEGASPTFHSADTDRPPRGAVAAVSAASIACLRRPALIHAANSAAALQGRCLRRRPGPAGHLPVRRRRRWPAPRRWPPCGPGAGASDARGWRQRELRRDLEGAPRCTVATLASATRTGFRAPPSWRTRAALVELGGARAAGGRVTMDMCMVALDDPGLGGRRGHDLRRRVSLDAQARPPAPSLRVADALGPRCPALQGGCEPHFVSLVLGLAHQAERRCRVSCRRRRGRGDARVVAQTLIDTSGCCPTRPPAGWSRREPAAGPDPHRPPLPLRADHAALLMRRAAIIVLDGLGIGPAADTDAYGDSGSDTLGNVARAVGGLRLPQLAALGLGMRRLDRRAGRPEPAARYGSASRERRKDSTTGHWEICGSSSTRRSRPTPTASRFGDRRVRPRTGRGVLGNRARRAPRFWTTWARSTSAPASGSSTPRRQRLSGGRARGDGRRRPSSTPHVPPRGRCCRESTASPR